MVIDTSRRADSNSNGTISVHRHRGDGKAMGSSAGPAMAGSSLQPPPPNLPISNSSHSASSHESSSTRTPVTPLGTSPLNSPRGGGSSIRRKLVVIGDGACGKTSLLVAYKDDSFTGAYVPTVFETSTASVPVENKIVELSLWDTAGTKVIVHMPPPSSLL